jgi:cytochrome c oxidase cbb3-type subunit 3
VTGDLQGIGTRTVDPLELQNLWVAGGKAEPFDAAVPPGPRDAMVVVTLASGEVVEGRLDRIDDFMVSVVRADGRRQSFRRVGNLPKIDIRDPLAAHRQLLQTYTDRDIHNVTAYLVTVK